MFMFKMNKAERIREAKAKSQKAVMIFQDTLKQLNTANEILLDVIDDEEELITEHQQNIQEAENSILSNQYVIDRLKDFVPTT